MKQIPIKTLFEVVGLAIVIYTCIYILASTGMLVNGLYFIAKGAEHVFNSLFKLFGLFV